MKKRPSKTRQELLDSMRMARDLREIIQAEAQDLALLDAVIPRLPVESGLAEVLISQRKAIARSLRLAANLLVEALEYAPGPVTLVKVSRAQAI